jgi:outer membrane protein OmpA-like peptidoglycan-associated protein
LGGNVNNPFTFEAELFEDYQQPYEEASWEWGEEMDEGWLGEVNRSSADYVRWVQQSLNQMLGLRLAVDGIAGPQTRSAIRSFQQQRGLTADGIVGPLTEAALIAAGASPPPGSSSPKPYAPGVPSPSPRPYGPVSPNACAEVSQPCEVLDQFGFDKSAVLPHHQPQIDRMARCVVASQSTARPIRSMRVVGHASPEGTDAYNDQLGLNRANAVIARLKEAIRSLSPGLENQIRFVPESGGERQPRVDNSTEQGRSRNRRVEVCFSTPPPPPPPPPPLPPPSCNKEEYARLVDKCVEDAKRCVIIAHAKLAKALLACKGNPFCNVRATAKYYLELKKCRDAIMPCDAAARRATNCP